MSNSLALATVTATLKNVLQSAFASNGVDPLAGASVTVVNPADRDTTKTGANVFLYQVSPNAALRNYALPARDFSGVTVTPPQAALDLHYLISFYGDPTQWEPQRLLGIAVRTLNAQPVLSPNIVSQTVASLAASTATSFMGQSDLASSIENVRLVDAEISLEEMSKLWSILLQTKYALSVLYVASVVLLDSPEQGVTALPVLQPNLTVNPIRSVSLVQVVATDATKFGVIVPGARVALLGSGLADPTLMVLVDGVPLQQGSPPVQVPIASQVDGRLEIVLPLSLAAGARAAQVASFAPGATLSTVESNLVTFALSPVISAVTTFGVIQGVNGLFSGVLNVPVVPLVAGTQNVTLLLNQKNPAPGQTSQGVVLRPDPASFGSPPASGTTNQIAFPFTNLVAGTYAARLRVDGAESPPVLTSSSPPSIGPEVTIP